jgi:hypothetical protein
MWFTIGVLAVVFYLHHQKHTPAPVTVQNVCSVGSAPCIQMNDGSGKLIAKFNDFRFAPNHCINYLDTSWKQYCGDYNLIWIGPDTSVQKKGSVIAT